MEQTNILGDQNRHGKYSSNLAQKINDEIKQPEKKEDMPIEVKSEPVLEARNESKESMLIRKCLEIAKLLGEGESVVHDYYVSENYSFRDQDLSIDYRNGQSMFGGGYLRTYQSWNRAVYLFDASIISGVDKINGINVDGDDYVVQNYTSGNWENKIEELHKKAMEKKNSSGGKP